MDVGQQCRLALNAQSRSPNEVIAAAAARWSADDHRSGANVRKERSDKGGQHKKRRRDLCLPKHLSEGDIVALEESMVRAYADFSSEEDGDSGLIDDRLLDD